MLCCFGLLASPTLLQGVIVGSRVATRRAAVQGAWPSNDLGAFWRPVITERLRESRTHGATQQAVDVLCFAADGDYQALFHAMQRMTSRSEAPQFWYAAAALRAKGVISTSQLPVGE